MEYDAWLQVTLTEICNLTCRYCLAKEELSRPSAVATTFDAPAFLNSPTNSFFFVSTEMTGCCRFWNDITCRLMYSN